MRTAQEMIDKRASDTPVKYRTRYLRVVSGNGGRRQAIHAFCLLTLHLS
jgi:hypothetical protein